MLQIPPPQAPFILDGDMSRDPSQQPLPAQRLLLLWGLALLLVVGGCAGPQPRPDIIPVPGYEGRQEQLYGRDLAPLQQRRIVLDPGHGGHTVFPSGPSAHFPQNIILTAPSG